MLLVMLRPRGNRRVSLINSEVGSLDVRWWQHPMGWFDSSVAMPE